jgi:hypothetical protein
MRALCVVLPLFFASPVFAADAATTAAPAAKVAPTTKAAPATQPAAPAVKKVVLGAKLEVPVTVDQAVDTGKGIIGNFAAKHVQAGIAGIICLFVFAWRRFLSGLLIGKIPSKFLPLVTMGVAFLAAIPQSLTVTPWSWKTFVWQGLITGAEAMMFWSAVVKFVTGEVKKA